MVKSNLDIRNEVQKAGISFWMVADRLGVADTTLSKWLRKELPNDKKKEIFSAISEIKSEFQLVEA